MDEAKNGRLKERKRGRLKGRKSDVLLEQFNS
jgi:hypothetical protein